MKRLWPCAMAILLLCGCNAPPAEPVETLPAGTAPEETSAPETFPETAPPAAVPTQTETVQETLSAGAYYREHLLQLLEGPTSETDETEAAPTEPTETVAEATEETASAKPGISVRQFAVLDVDGDGREELVVLLTEDDGVTEYILDDTQEELWLHAAAVFYPNGAAATVSGGEGEAFVPYTLYQYDAERDVYYEVAHVEVVDLAELEAAGLADEYPEDIDVSETGRVYLIGSGDPVDEADYVLWVSSWRTEPMDIPFVELTKENIETIKD